MFNDMAALERITSSFLILIVLALIVLTVLWAFVPFSIYGIKNLLKKSIKEQERTNELLQSLGKEISRKRVEGIGRETNEKGLTDNDRTGPAI